jgi:hypothetical protein
MRTFTLALLFVLLPGCALLDAFLPVREVHATDDTGAPLYLTPEGETTTAAHAPDGAPHRPLTVALMRPPAAPDFTALIGPWGALIGGLLAAGAGAYARARNRQRLQETRLRARAEAGLGESAATLAFLVRLVEKLKAGGPELDTDGDGRVSLAELKAYVRDRGARFKDPAFLAEVVRIAEASMAPEAETAALKGLLNGAGESGS